jgi:topoisomerase-4 subunit B
MSKYKDSDIRVLKGLEPVRLRPGMYTNTENSNHILDEVIDNAVDECLGGFADRIDVIMHEDGSVSVKDNGRGIPVGIHPEQKIPTVEVIFTTLHAGGKFDKDDGGAYAFSGGLHGVGVSVTNALSHWVTVEVKKETGTYLSSFKDGFVDKKMKKIDKKPNKESSTKVRFLPDNSYFENDGFVVKGIKTRLESKAVLLSKVTITLLIEETGEEHEWYYEDGLSGYLSSTLEDLVGGVFSGAVYDDGTKYNAGEGAEWAMVWTQDRSVVSKSFVNMIPTVLGGAHESGLKGSVLECLRAFSIQYSILPKNVKLLAEDVCMNLNFILSTKLLDPQFQGQTKEKLSSKEANKIVFNSIKDNFDHWLNDNVSIGKEICEIAISNATNRINKGKKVVRKKTTNIVLLPGKLSDCETSITDEAELFIVEGDSAGGSAKMGREKYNQAILPLRGKPTNTWEASNEQVLGDKEINDISIAIGVDPHVHVEDGDIERLRYGKVCILSDADKDGHHIQVLLLALFYKHFPKLIENGNIYIACPPLYRVDCLGRYKDLKFYALDEEELEQITSKLKKEKKAYRTGRFKGLGEMSPRELWETSLDPDNRRLMKVVIKEDPNTMMDMLLSKKKAKARRSWIERNSDWGVDDE